MPRATGRPIDERAAPGCATHRGPSLRRSPGWTPPLPTRSKLGPSWTRSSPSTRWRSTKPSMDWAGHRHSWCRCPEYKGPPSCSTNPSRRFERRSAPQPVRRVRRVWGRRDRHPNRSSASIAEAPWPSRWTSRCSWPRPLRRRHRRENVAPVELSEPATHPSDTRRDDQGTARLVIRYAMVGSPYPGRTRV
jgi:hypothetical protein